ncbi:glycosyltransferase [candidate division KSB1 bacterium]|nr:MAG: glycosyltransferase [candidate division KSB1 bacterium]
MITENKPEISIVVPLFNEKDSLKELHKKISDVMIKNGEPYEIIFIDDGSTDDSFEYLKKIYEDDKNVRVFRLQRNYGKSAALSTGFKNAKGEVIITIDADLQDDPEEIPNLLKKINDGYDLVSGWKMDRKDPFIKIVSSKFFNFITRLLTGLKIHDINCGLKAYRRKVTENIKVYGELHRYIPALAKVEGFKIDEVKVRHHPRKYGKSKYGVTRFFKGFTDLLTVLYISRFTTRPMHLFGLAGLIFFIIGFIINLLLTIWWFKGQGIGNRPLFFLGILLMIFGIQLFSIGLLGEMIANIRKNDENYIFKDILQ